MPRTLIGNFKGPQGDTGPKGLQGPQGLQGLTGAEGPAGKSAYETAVEGGYTGTEEEFAEFLASGQKLPSNIVSFESYEGPPEPPLPKDADLLDGYPASYYAKAVDIVVDYTHAKTGTLHSLTGPEGAGKISWTMTATAEDGDTWEINGRPAAVLYNDGLPIMPHSLIAGDMLWAQVSTGKVVLTIPMPGSNPNLLINSDFRDPINQRGQTEYQVIGYTIDMWRTWFDNMHVSLLEDGVLLDYTGTNSDGIYQYFENGQNLLVDKTVTISALTKEYGLITKSGVLTSEASRIMQTTGFGDITLYHSTTKIQPFFFRILVNTGKSVTIIAAKLELGPRQTLAHKDAEDNWVLNDPPPDKQQELAKCQRYFEIIPVTVTTAIGATRVIGTRYAVPKRAIPAITFYPEGAAAGVGNYKNHYLDLNSPGFISKTGGDYIAATGVTYGTELGFGLIATTESVNKEPYYWGAYISAEL